MTKLAKMSLLEKARFAEVKWHACIHQTERARVALEAADKDEAEAKQVLINARHKVHPV